MSQPADKQRSTPQMRRMFAVFEAAWIHWPSANDFQPVGGHPMGMHHLRRYLEVQAGRGEIVLDMTTRGMSGAAVGRMIAGLLQEHGTNTLFIDMSGFPRVIACKALSISYPEMTHSDACKLFDEVSNVLLVEMGMTADQLLRQHEKAA